MNIVSSARFQFAMTTIFHFFFVPLSIGTVFVVAIMESMYVHTGKSEYKKMTKFWGKCLPFKLCRGSSYRNYSGIPIRNELV